VLVFAICSFRLQKIYFRHSVLFLNQLFKTELLEPSWAGVLVPLVRYICDTVITHSETSMNICHYVHVKRVSASCTVTSANFSCVEARVRKAMSRALAPCEHFLDFEKVVSNQPRTPPSFPKQNILINWVFALQTPNAS